MIARDSGEERGGDLLGVTVGDRAVRKERRDGGTGSFGSARERRGDVELARALGGFVRLAWELEAAMSVP